MGCEIRNYHLILYIFSELNPSRIQLRVTVKNFHIYNESENYCRTINNFHNFDQDVFVRDGSNEVINSSFLSLYKRKSPINFLL